MISLPVNASDTGKTAVAAGETNVNAVEMEFLSSFTVADALKPGRIPEDNLQRIELWDTQIEPPHELPAIRPLTVVAAAEK